MSLKPKPKGKPNQFTKLIEGIRLAMDDREAEAKKITDALNLEIMALKARIAEIERVQAP